jgi:deazaflavin-dependent oxidoreductase (nitroreductase family)
MTLTKVGDAGRPSGISLAVYRVPIWLYRLGLGRLLGQRFLLLIHRGRKTGATRRAVLEVVKHDPEEDVYFVASGFGEGSHWYRNLQATPRARIQVAGRTLEVQGHGLETAEAEQVLVDYGRRNPRSARFVAGLMGYRMDGSDADLRALARIVPIVALRVRPPSGEHTGAW